MPGYQCGIHDGQQDAVNIHQRIGNPGVMATCDECEPIYLMGALAQIIGVDADALYANVQRFQKREHERISRQLAALDSPDDPAGIAPCPYCAHTARGPESTLDQQISQHIAADHPDRAPVGAQEGGQQ